MQKHYILIKILKDFSCYKAGTVHKVLATDTGVPIDPFWRRRFTDAVETKYISYSFVNEQVKASALLEAKKTEDKKLKNKEKGKDV